MKFKQNIYSFLVTINSILLVILLGTTIYGIYNYSHYVQSNKAEPVIINIAEVQNNNNSLDDKTNIQTEQIQNNIKSNNLSNASIIIAIIDTGLSSNTTQEVLQLAPEVAIGVSAYASDIDDVIKQAIGYNHKVFMNIPMEPKNYPIEDPGPYSLITQLSEKDNISRLNFLLNRNSLINGVYSDKNEIFTNNIDNSRLIIRELKKHNLRYLYGAGKENIFLNQLSKDENYNIFFSDLLIDEEINIDQINMKLDKLEKLAIDNKLAIGIARSYPLSVRALKDWLPTLEAKGIKLISIQ
ncbi:MAG: divergent polysaccharide deacetylase family protein [Alphaproteobacteria bacterium]